jgi:hypothetical protein
MACILDLINDLEPLLLDTYPKLKLFREEMMELPAFAGVKHYPSYFKRG